MEQKYKLLENITKQTPCGRTLYRIQALRKFGVVTEGRLGGWIEREYNLSHEGNAWVSGEAMVYGGARVSNDARVLGQAEVYGDASIEGHARVSDVSRVFDHAVIARNAAVYGGWVYGNAFVGGSAEISNGTRIFGDAVVYGVSVIETGGFINDRNAVMTFCNVGTENGVLTVYRGAGEEILCSRGCFFGTVEEFLRRSEAEHNVHQIAEYRMLIEVAVTRIRRLTDPYHPTADEQKVTW